MPCLDRGLAKGKGHQPLILRTEFSHFLILGSQGRCNQLLEFVKALQYAFCHMAFRFHKLTYLCRRAAPFGTSFIQLLTKKPRKMRLQSGPALEGFLIRENIYIAIVKKSFLQAKISVYKFLFIFA